MGKWEGRDENEVRFDAGIPRCHVTCSDRSIDRLRNPEKNYRIVVESWQASWAEHKLSRFYLECVLKTSRSEWLQWKVICLSWPATSCVWLAVILHKTRHSRRSAQLLECRFRCCRVCCDSQRSIGIARRMQGVVPLQVLSPTITHTHTHLGIDEMKTYM